MEREDLIYQSYVQILKEELVPAMGCTEPIAIAYAAAKARDILGRIPEKVKVEASGSIIKNVKSVIVPHTEHLKGIPAAAAAGIIAGDADNKLEVISEVTPQQAKEIKEYLDNTEIVVEYIDHDLVFDLVVTVYDHDDYAKVRISNYHTNIVLIEKNHDVLFEVPVSQNGGQVGTDRQILTMEKIWEFVQDLQVEDVKDILDRQMTYNMAISHEGLKGNYGANIGRVLLNAYPYDIRNRAKAMAAAGSDARMNGCEMPVVINSGSGNQGMTCSIPVIVYAQELHVSEKKLYQALALSNLIAIHQKTGIGTLSAYCGAVSAGAAAGAGIAFLNGGGYKDVIHTVVNALAIVSGMICDGLKPHVLLRLLHQLMQVF